MLAHIGYTHQEAEFNHFESDEFCDRAARKQTQHWEVNEQHKVIKMHKQQHIIHMQPPSMTPYWQNTNTSSITPDANNNANNPNAFLILMMMSAIITMN